MPASFLSLHTGDRFQHIEIDFPAFVAACGTPDDKRREMPFFRDYALYGSTMFGRAKLCAAASRAKTEIPDDFRAEAERHSRELVFTLSTFRSRVVRDKAHGTLDSSKLARLAAPGLSAREFDRLAGSAFKHREHVQSQTTRPRVAVVGDFADTVRAADPAYSPRVAKLAFVLAEAARIAGVEVACYGSRGDCSSRMYEWCHAMGGKGHGKPGHYVTTLKNWGTEIDGPTLASVANLFAYSAVAHGLDAHLCRKMRGMGSESGRGGVEFARMQGAQIVIAIGGFTGDATPDILLDPGTSIPAAVAAIVAHISERKAA